MFKMIILAWNQLGECYWKKGDFKHAENCFKQANAKVRILYYAALFLQILCIIFFQNTNKVSLRSLSMVMRQLPAADAKEKAEIIRKSMEIAQQALELDPNDGRSLSKKQYIMGI